jgi:hypothetical protein
LRVNESLHTPPLFSPINLIDCYYKDISEFIFFVVVGRPFANSISMILLIIRMKVFPEKRKELSQTITSLIGSPGFDSDR